MNRGITKENLLLIVPPALTYDPSKLALAALDADALETRVAEIDRVRIIPNIDGLDEPLLDILAYDFKVDWWDPEYGIDEKRRTLKGSWRVHKILGTKAAVETALRAVYAKSDVVEWFEYEDGKPYHFKIYIDLTGEKPEVGKLERVVERVGFYKNLRSHIDSIEYTIRFPETPLYVGGGVGSQVQMGIPLEPDVYDFADTLHTGGAFAARMDLPVPEDTTQPPATTILRTGGVCTIISNLSGED